MKVLLLAIKAIDERVNFLSLLHHSVVKMKQGGESIIAIDSRQHNLKMFVSLGYEIQAASGAMTWCRRIIWPQNTSCLS